MPAEPDYRGRFAPSPTGPLHFGSLVAALASWLHARAAGGSWLVRVEDLDTPREVAGAATLQLDSLRAFGLHADRPPWYQSARHPAYRAALDRLRATGCIYPCRCSRADLAPFGGRHPPACVASDPGRRAAWRVRVDDQEIAFYDAVQGRHGERIASGSGDFVVLRSDGIVAYQLAVVVDDAAQGITDVVRGADLLDSTPRQILLQRLLGLPTPRYLHVPLAVDDDGAKLAKSTQATAIDARDPLPALTRAWRFLGQTPFARDPAAAAGMASPAEWLQHAAAAFKLAAIPRSHAISVGGQAKTARRIAGTAHVESSH